MLHSRRIRSISHHERTEERIWTIRSLPHHRSCSLVSCWRLRRSNHAFLAIADTLVSFARYMCDVSSSSCPWLWTSRAPPLLIVHLRQLIFAHQVTSYHVWDTFDWCVLHSAVFVRLQCWPITSAWSTSAVNFVTHLLAVWLHKILHPIQEKGMWCAVVLPWSDGVFSHI